MILTGLHKEVLIAMRLLARVRELVVSLTLLATLLATTLGVIR